MTGRRLKTVLATLVVGLVSVGTAEAAPITVGQFTWDDLAQVEDPSLGPSFKLANTSDILTGSPPPVVVTGPFTQILLVLTLEQGQQCDLVTLAGAASRTDDCKFELASVDAGTGAVDLAYADPGVVLSATLTLFFNGYQLDGPWTITADDPILLESGITERYIAVVPEPASLMLLGTGLAVIARRRRR